jgi:hypothetical protein
MRTKNSEFRIRKSEVAVAVFLLLIGTTAFCADQIEANTSPDGTLSLVINGKMVCEFGASAFDEGWKNTHANAGADGKFSMKIGAAELKGAVDFQSNADGSLSAKYSFTPSKDVTLNSLNISADLPINLVRGTKWKIDDAEGTFPAEHKDTMLHSAKIKTLKLSPKDMPEISITFTEPTNVLLQDNRQWNTQSFVIRAGPSGKFKQNEAVKIGYTISTSAPIKVMKDGPVTIVAGADWIPLKTELEIEPGSALDFSSMNLTEAPAGKYGRVIAREDGQFVFEKEKITARRFYGVNLCFSGQYMTHAEADKLAERLSRLG